MTFAVADVDGVRHVTLSRPPVNALTMHEYDGLAAAFDVRPAFGRAGPRIVVMRADGRVWCAGQDLDELTAVTVADERATYLQRAARGVAAVAACPVPVVALVDGPAVGAGALLLACCDIVLASPEASVTFPEVRLGLLLGRSLLAGALPDRVVTHALATGATIDATRLHALGMVSELVSGSLLARRGDAVAESLLELSDESLLWLRAGSRPQERAASYLAEVTDAGDAPAGAP